MATLTVTVPFTLAPSFGAALTFAVGALLLAMVSRLSTCFAHRVDGGGLRFTRLWAHSTFPADDP
jgi:Na+/serine symporter